MDCTHELDQPYVTMQLHLDSIDWINEFILFDGNLRMDLTKLTN